MQTIDLIVYLLKVDHLIVSLNQSPFTLLLSLFIIISTTMETDSTMTYFIYTSTRNRQDISLLSYRLRTMGIISIYDNIAIAQ